MKNLIVVYFEMWFRDLSKQIFNLTKHNIYDVIFDQPDRTSDNTAH